MVTKLVILMALKSEEINHGNYLDSIGLKRLSMFEKRIVCFINFIAMFCNIKRPEVHFVAQSCCPCSSSFYSKDRIERSSNKSGDDNNNNNKKQHFRYMF